MKNNKALINPCPCCGGEARMQVPNMHHKTCITCTVCYTSSCLGTPEEVATSWNRRAGAEPPNVPLTLEELRGMDGEPVWNETTKEWMLINLADGRALNNDGLWRSLDDRYYRRKPEGGR